MSAQKNRSTSPDARTVAVQADHMHVTLIGGGWEGGAQATVYGRFLREASVVGVRHSGAPRIAIVLLDEGDGVDELGERLARALRSARDVEPLVVPVPLGSRLDVDDLAGTDALLVGGGLTPGYADSLVPVRDELRRWLSDGGAPYAGFSAGAAIASVDAVVGGWLHRGHPVCPEDAAEDLEEVTVVPGLGLVPFTVDVHADAWGTTPRLQAAVTDLGEGRVGYALDENTALIAEGSTLTTVGRGQARRVVGRRIAGAEAGTPV